MYAWANKFSTPAYSLEILYYVACKDLILLKIWDSCFLAYYRFLGLHLLKCSWMKCSWTVIGLILGEEKPYQRSDGMTQPLYLWKRWHWHSVSRINRHGCCTRTETTLMFSLAKPENLTSLGKPMLGRIHAFIFPTSCRSLSWNGAQFSHIHLHISYEFRN